MVKVSEVQKCKSTLENFHIDLNNTIQSLTKCYLVIILKTLVALQQPDRSRYVHLLHHASRLGLLSLQQQYID